MKQKCKSLFCALLCLVLMCAAALPAWAATTAPAFGTDVSQHNGKGVDYTAWKKAGKTFTMIRMSYGNDHLDPQFWDNVNAAEAAGVPLACTITAMRSIPRRPRLRPIMLRACWLR